MSLDISNEHVAWDKADDGIVRLSWNDQNSKLIKTGEVLFELLLSGEEIGMITPSDHSNYLNELYDEVEGQLLRIQPHPHAIVQRPDDRSFPNAGDPGQFRLHVQTGKVRQKHAIEPVIR